MSLYETLGVPRDADAATIKRAYRKRAQKAHPDRGGSVEVFHQVQLAYDVLSDPVRRKKFDEHGGTGVGPDPHQQALQVIAALVLEAIDRAPDLEHTDLHELVVQTIKARIQQFHEQKRALAQRVAKLERAVKRFHRKGQGENLIATLITSQIAAVRRDMVRIDGEVKTGEGLLAVLAEYSYETDQLGSALAAAMQYQQAQGLFGIFQR